MMTASVLSAGGGYLYYTKNIATGDVQRAPGTALTDYYTVEGNPPGVWIGSGTQLLGVAGQVSEAQMKALFGEGLHPNADAITAAMRVAGDSEKNIADAIALGRGFSKYDVKDATLRVRVDAAYLEFERVNSRFPTRDEQRQLRMVEGAIVFRDVHGRAASDSEELAKYVTAAMKPGQHAIAGFDLTFSPPKSVSVLWATAEPTIAGQVEQAHTLAIQDTIRDIERNSIATRAGINGVRQIDVEGGVIATAFKHYESRNGDPQLHTHVVIANKVQGIDGKWRTLDSRLLLREVVASSELYNMHLFDRLEHIGLAGVPRTVTAGKATVLEIEGVSQKLMTLFSSRNQSIMKVTAKHLAAYQEQYGRTPDENSRRKLSALAWQESRPKKDTPRTIAELRADVRAQAIAAGLRGELRDTPTFRQVFIDPHLRSLDLHAAAAEIMGTVEAARSTWGQHHVTAEITRWVSFNRNRTFTITDGGVPRTLTRDEARDFLTRTALQLDSIKVTPEHVHGRFVPLTRHDGESFYVAKGRTLYTSTRVLAAEQRLLTAARTVSVTPGAATIEHFAEALLRLPNKDQAQVALAREFVTSRTDLVVGIGPAGTGKTRTMKLAAAAVHTAGGRMIGLAFSKQGVKVFRDEVQIPTFTIDGFLTAHRGAATTGRPVSAIYRVGPGDLVVVDEAAMASTSHLDQVVTLVTEAGGRVRYLGDHAQIAAVGAGGAVRMLVQEVGALELENVYRFSNHQEAAASKLLRAAEPHIDPFAWYRDNGRIIAATKDRIVDVLFTDYLNDLNAGRATVMGAPTREYVDELNGRAQAHAIAVGDVTGTRSALLSDDQQAHVGDRIMTRLNRSDLTMNQGRDAVDNGDLFVVTKVHRGGELRVRNVKHHGTVTLPGDYVRQHTHLGYAFTANQEQGETFGGKTDAGVYIEGVSRGIVTARTARANAYVLATRGTTNNVLYVEVEDGQHPADVLGQVARNVDTNLSAHEMIGIESARVLDLSRLVDEHADIVGLANEIRFTTLTNRVLGPEHAAVVTESAGWGAVAAGLARAERHGRNLDGVLSTTWGMRDFGNADDIGAVLSYRIENYLDSLADEPATITAAPSVAPNVGVVANDWVVDRTLETDQDLPDDWKLELAHRAEYILNIRMPERGAALTIEQPAWTVQLGPLPPEGARLTAWMELAAEIDLFRNTYKVTPDEATAIPPHLQDKPLGMNLTARVTALHKGTAIRHAAGNTTTAEPAQLFATATERATTADDLRPRSDAEQVAHTLDPDRATQSEQAKTRLAKLLNGNLGTPTAAAGTKPVIADESQPTTEGDRLRRMLETARKRAADLAAVTPEDKPGTPKYRSPAPQRGRQIS